jgi:hypothetical protein
MNLGETSKLASIAVQYGPFFFSILFCIVLSKWGYSIYKNANVRVEPKPASKQEINTYRYYFAFITIFGVILYLWRDPRHHIGYLVDKTAGCHSSF